MAKKERAEHIGLVLQGGGALGAYQAGAYMELMGEGWSPDWVAGISIGAINAALIAGNPPERRAERLTEFWHRLSGNLIATAPQGTDFRSWFNEISAALTATFGLTGFFSPRFLSPFFAPRGSENAISFYDTSPLRKTLLELVDFDLLNSGAVRLSVGAVNVTSGNFVYFDTDRMRVGVEHIMASGALPPGFPPVEIEGELYWDGGLVSNTPLQYVLEQSSPHEDMVLFQIDLFDARGEVPQTLFDVEHRIKDIRFSSRTRLNTDRFREMQRIRRAANRLYSKLPDELKSDRDAKFLEEVGCDSDVTIVHLIHRLSPYTKQSKDYEFSRASIEEHWQAGQYDVARTLRHPDWVGRGRPKDGIAVYDLARDGS
ncbi:patatin-like phospholipase family protein [Breoghania sp.]|uniref:patatin-like phospholipase family protein n=1 Tax=Breoghania sp. TaxID=2065378 RepID=UPI0029C9E22A|nr:patatin-like phospholipase family protein [Breoghania sp.]